jgi:hypothetical protein
VIGLRIHSKRLGSHVHARVYVSDDLVSFALTGELVMRESEYQAFRNTLAQGADVQKLLTFEEICDLSQERGAPHDQMAFGID